MSGSSSSERDHDTIAELIRNLGAIYGPLAWWSDDPELVIIGAMLTQQTRWEHVETALDNLGAAGLLSLAALAMADPVVLEQAIYSTGFYRVKARRLKALAGHLIGRYGGVDGMRRCPTEDLRADLLSCEGVGAETADSILCYGFGRCMFVIDAYTTRICSCAGVRQKGPRLKCLFEEVLPGSVAAYQDTHAHMVEFGKENCQRQRCEQCWIRNLNG